MKKASANGIWEKFFMNKIKLKKNKIISSMKIIRRFLITRNDLFIADNSDNTYNNTYIISYLDIFIFRAK